MTGPKRYKLVLHTKHASYDVAWALDEVDEMWSSLGKAREMARAIELVFPDVEARVISIDAQGGPRTMKRL